MSKPLQWYNEHKETIPIVCPICKEAAREYPTTDPTLIHSYACDRCKITFKVFFVRFE